MNFLLHTHFRSLLRVVEKFEAFWISTDDVHIDQSPKLQRLHGKRNFLAPIVGAISVASLLLLLLLGVGELHEEHALPLTVHRSLSRLPPRGTNDRELHRGLCLVDGELGEGARGTQEARIGTALRGPHRRYEGVPISVAIVLAPRRPVQGPEAPRKSRLRPEPSSVRE